MRYFLLKIGFVVLCACYLSACNSERLMLHAEASQQLNMDANSNSLSVQVRVYQLRDKQAFVQANFIKLWQSPKQALGDSLLASREFDVGPGQTRRLLIKGDPSAQYIAAIAIFRKPMSRHWRAIRKMPTFRPYRRSKIRLYLSQDSLRWGSP